MKIKGASRFLPVCTRAADKCDVTSTSKQSPPPPPPQLSRPRTRLRAAPDGSRHGPEATGCIGRFRTSLISFGCMVRLVMSRLLSISVAGGADWEA